MIINFEVRATSWLDCKEVRQGINDYAQHHQVITRKMEITKESEHEILIECELDGNVKDLIHLFHCLGDKVSGPVRGSNILEMEK